MSSADREAGADPPDSSLRKRESGFPWAFLAALLITAGVAATVGLLRDRIANPRVLMYAQKLAWATDGPAVDVMVLGDSQAVASIRPGELEPYLPAGTTLVNFALPAAGPSGAEMVLRRYLTAHDPPRLVVLAYTDPALDENPAQFAGYVSPNLFGFRDVLRVSLRTARPGIVLDWLAVQIPTFRFRADLGTLALAVVLKVAPRLDFLIVPRTGLDMVGLGERLLRFHTGNRFRRNREYLESAERERGWKYFREIALSEERLSPGFRDFKSTSGIDRREWAALRATASMCQERGVAVLVIPLPKARAWFEMQEKNGQLARFSRVWERLASEFPAVTRTNRAAVSFEHRYFADRTHLNPVGVREFSAIVGPLIASAFEAAK